MTKRVRRLDGVAESVTKSVEVSRLVEPKFLTLTKMPAGQVAFKVVRSDRKKEATVPTPEAAPATEVRRRRIRSTMRSALLYIEFPSGTTEKDVEAAIAEYGIEGYELVQDGDKYCLRRSDLKETPADAVTVMIGSGRRAGIVRSEAPAYQVQDPMPHIAIVAIDFNKEVFADIATVEAYLQRHDIDFLEKGVENADNVIRVLRSEIPEAAETRKVQVEDGVVAVVTRAEAADLLTASPFVEVVSDTAYGQWGWGQLDFSARMADVEFCEAAEEASYSLRRVVEDILFYSQLPTSVRKELIARAAGQFSDYIGTLLDALPAKVILINRSNLETNKESSMPPKTTEAPAGAEGTPVVRTEPANPTLAVTPPDDSVPVTRGEIKTIVAEAVAAAMVATAAPAAPAATQRADDAAEGKDGEAPASTEDKTLKAVEAVVTRSVAGLQETVVALEKRLAAFEGSTVIRSDGGDGVAVAKKDPFVGVLSQNRK